MDQKPTLQDVINGLDKVREGCKEALQDEFPLLALRCHNHIGILIGQLSHAAGVTVGTLTQPVEDKKPTHFLGIPLGAAPAPIKQETMIPSLEEKTQLQELTEQAFAEFQTLEPSILKETYGDLIIRAVAVMAGMDVTPTNPEKVNVAFIRDVIAAVKVKADQIKQEIEADEAANKSKQQNENPL